MTELKKGTEVEFTTDNWVTIYTGYIHEVTLYSYYIISKKYGNFYHSKTDVRALTNSKKSI